MKRRLLIAAIFLLAGAVVNVAVAWGCYLAARPQGYRSAYQPSDAGTTAWWNENKPEGVTDELAGFDSVDRFGWSLVTLHGDEGGLLRILPSGQLRISRGIQDLHLAMYLTAGLPMRSLHGQSWFRKGEMIQQSGIISTGSEAWLPCGPIWPGFAVNTIFYAAILWSLILGPMVVRRFIRQRRGLCPKCAYPRGESDVCSECGRVPAAR